MNEDYEDFFKIIVKRASKKVIKGIDIKLAIEQAMKEEVEFEAEMLKGESGKAQKMRNLLSKEIYGISILSLLLKKD
jgi:hypothetical protein